MVMETLQIRLNKGLVKLIDSWIEQGVYSSRSEAIRDSVRRFVWKNEVGTIKLKGGSGVELIRKAREKLSKEKIDLDEINNL